MISPFVQADATNWLALALAIAIDIWTWGSIQTGWQKISSPPDHLPSSGWSPPLESVVQGWPVAAFGAVKSSGDAIDVGDPA
ncbi:hypothetical protein [Streptomyces bobili]|uniref:hypothetical protein n=1 Tax=Streptomyces bobili TaxID=67280 RepID=UPI0037166A9D